MMMLLMTMMLFDRMLLRIITITVSSSITIRMMIPMRRFTLSQGFGHGGKQKNGYNGKNERSI
jgi:hypothetical protein